MSYNDLNRAATTTKKDGPTDTIGLGVNTPKQNSHRPNPKTARKSQNCVLLARLISSRSDQPQKVEPSSLRRVGTTGPRKNHHARCRAARAARRYCSTSACSRQRCSPDKTSQRTRGERKRGERYLQCRYPFVEAVPAPLRMRMSTRPATMAARKQAKKKPANSSGSISILARFRSYVTYTRSGARGRELT